jgi:hypothetical protein
MNFDNLTFNHLEYYLDNDFLKKGDIYCYKLDKYDDIYHTFLIYNITNKDVEVIHFNNSYGHKSHSFIGKEKLSNIINKRMIAKVNLLINPTNNEETILKKAYDIYLNFYKWPKYHFIFNNCHHFIHYCLYNEKPLLCGQNKELVKYFGAFTIVGAAIYKFICK